MTAEASAPSPALLDEAADWLVQLHSSDVTEQDRHACRLWQQRSPDHARAWARAEQLISTLGGLPPALAMPTLDRPLPSLASRRATVAKLAALLAIGPTALATWELADGPALTADHRTSVGEHRDIRLPDGTQVTMNTASAVDVRFTASERLIHLRSGEILVTTSPDMAAVHRPFRVSTQEGVMEALGTRFTVRQDTGQTHAAVLEGAIRIQPRLDAANLVLSAGQQSTFTAQSIASVLAADESAVAWAQGMLLADGMPLDEFAAEISRYRRGVVRCEPAVASLRVSGAFPIVQTERTLAMLEATYPVSAKTRWGGLWVTLAPN